MDRRGASPVSNWPSEIREGRLAWYSTKLCHVQDSNPGGKSCSEVFYPAE